jgi:iron-sulfur cluster assembly protein
MNENNTDIQNNILASPHIQESGNDKVKISYAKNASLNITVTDSACAYIKKMLEKNNSLGFRLSIKKTGCSGYSYSPSLIEAVIETDVTIALDNGVQLYLDASWQHLLQNLHIDYIEEEKSGLKQKRLIFTNPNEASRCGCGESFHVKS